MQNNNRNPRMMEPNTLNNRNDLLLGNMILEHLIPENQFPPDGEGGDPEEDNLEANEFGDYDLETDDDDLEDVPSSIDQEESYPGLSEEDLDEEDQSEDKNGQ